MIDSARGKGAVYVPSEQIKTTLDVSRARKESAFMSIDMGAFMGELVPMPQLDKVFNVGIGFGKRVARLRLEIMSK